MSRKGMTHTDLLRSFPAPGPAAVSSSTSQAKYMGTKRSGNRATDRLAFAARFARQHPCNVEDGHKAGHYIIHAGRCSRRRNGTQEQSRTGR